MYDQFYYLIEATLKKMDRIQNRRKNKGICHDTLDLNVGRQKSCTRALKLNFDFKTIVPKFKTIVPKIQDHRPENY